ncbi:MAG: hypothetical protein IJ480_01850 [Clostridia bacterium]|nr:hypothetical protein [Clostridia bacterium]
METKYNWNAFYEIGYTKEEMLDLENYGWAGSVLETISEESYYTARNAAVLLKAFDRETVFRFMVAYLSAFLLSEKTFSERLRQIITKAGSGWQEILTDEYWNSSEGSILVCMGYLVESDWETALLGWVPGCED